MAYNLTIKKDTTGEWVVEPVDGARMVKSGENVVWRIDPSESATAHLQFLEDLFELLVQFVILLMHLLLDLSIIHVEHQKNLVLFLEHDLYLIYLLIFQFLLQFF